MNQSTTVVRQQNVPVINRNFRACPNSNHFIQYILPELVEVDLKVKEFNQNSFRITDDQKTLDYFPTSSKIYDYDTQKWKKINNTDEIFTYFNK